MKHMRISTKVLAQMCGVSQGTVDRALHGRYGVNPETKEKILALARTYGFRDEAADGGMKYIGIVVFNLNNAYFTRLIGDLQAELQKNGYLLAVMLSNYEPQTELNAIQSLYNGGADGIILCSTDPSQAFGQYLATLSIPVVAVGNRLPGVPYVGIDDALAMKELCEYVISLGYRQIVYFSPAIVYENAYAQKQRERGFREVAARFENYRVVTSTEELDSRYDESVAIICSTDHYAMQAYLKTKHTHIFGFDGIDMIREMRMPIRSITYSTGEIAKAVIATICTDKKEDTTIPHHLPE